MISLAVYYGFIFVVFMSGSVPSVFSLAPATPTNSSLSFPQVFIIKHQNLTIQYIFLQTNFTVHTLCLFILYCFNFFFLRAAQIWELETSVPYQDIGLGLCFLSSWGAAMDWQPVQDVPTVSHTVTAGAPAPHDPIESGVFRQWMLFLHRKTIQV